MSAEAAGDLELAAERYVLSGQFDAAVRVHLARADRAGSRKNEILALRDAHHWATQSQSKGIGKRVAKRLGRALHAQLIAEGITTERDRERLREAAAFLVAGGDTLRAGEALETIGDDRGAAVAYRAGGHVDKLEEALRRDQSERATIREEKDAFAEYELAISGGDRDLALSSLRRCVAVAEKKTEYRRLLDELEARLIAAGRVTLLLGNAEGTLNMKTRVIVFSGERLLLGRDALCDFVLRAGGISRQHAEIEIIADGDDAGYLLTDAGSKNGTSIGGIRIEGSINLEESGRFDLGDHCTIDYNVSKRPKQLTLSVNSGLDRGQTLRAARNGELIRLDDLGIPATIVFRQGRPILLHPSVSLRLGEHLIAHGDVQLIHGDVLSLGEIDIEIV